jgi:hypothetical protein
VRHHIFVLGVAALLGLGCQRSRSAESVCAAFFSAVGEGDAGAVFDNLLETTQWSLYSVQKNHRAMRELIDSSYPPAERPAAASRLYAAEAESGRDLFIRIYPSRYASAFSTRLGSGDPEVKSSGGESLCQAQGGTPFRIARATSGRLGIADLDAEWNDAQVRTFHDLDTIKKNAELYKQAGGADASKK